MFPNPWTENRGNEHTDTSSFVYYSGGSTKLKPQLFILDCRFVLWAFCFLLQFDLRLFRLLFSSDCVVGFGGSEISALGSALGK
ncbi:hypothetical protein ACET3Z_003827 [Daucus carota]